MAITYSSQLGLDKPDLYQDNRENSYAAALDKVSQAVAGYAAVSMTSDADYTLSTTGAYEARSPKLKVTSSVSLTATRNLTLDVAAGKYRTGFYFVWNATTGGQILTVKTTAGGSPATVNIANGKARLLWHDGANFYAAGPEIDPLTGLILPRFIGARARNSTNLSIPNATFTALTFDSERYDTDAIHSTSVNTGRLTLPFAGGWRFGANAVFASNATGARSVQIKVGSIVVARDQRPAVGGSLDTMVPVSGEYLCAAGDILTAEVYQDSGGSLNVTAQANYSPEFWCSYIGP